MSERNDGGPAFPGAVLPEHPHHPPGMSKREWFAAQALPEVMREFYSHSWQQQPAEQVIAQRAYAQADAMLAAPSSPAQLEVLEAALRSLLNLHIAHHNTAEHVAARQLLEAKQ